MTKKDEAAEAFKDKDEAEFKGEYYNAGRLRSFKSGWTQHGDELMKMAKEKAFSYMTTDKYIKFSELEKIIEELGK